MIASKWLSSLTDKVTLVFNRDLGQTVLEFTLTTKASVARLISSTSA